MRYLLIEISGGHSGAMPQADGNVIAIASPGPYGGMARHAGERGRLVIDDDNVVRFVPNPIEIGQL